MTHLGKGVAQAEGDDFLAVRAAAREAPAEIIFAGGHHEEVHKALADHGVVAGADLGRALHIDVHHDIFAVLEKREHLGFESPVVMPMDLGVFEEVPGGSFTAEFFGGEEEVFPPVGFAGAGSSGRAGNRKAHLPLLRKGPAKGALAGAGRPGNEQENTKPG